ncbi:hypothetical protein BJX61DRAFT_516148 [Aspergillus egyptiacus]|nr:hypothetical protein BJX61DRAFT_516148 [Aspergillus egyptiacus]
MEVLSNCHDYRTCSEMTLATSGHLPRQSGSAGSRRVILSAFGAVSSDEYDDRASIAKPRCMEM